VGSEPQRVRRDRVHVRVVLDRPGDRLLRGGGSPNALNDLGFILLAFAIFNTYMLIWSSRVNVAVFLVFLTLEITEIVLSVGFFSGSDAIVQVGGVIGVVTAAVAWYTSAAGVVNGMAGRQVLRSAGRCGGRADPDLGPDRPCRPRAGNHLTPRPSRPSGSAVPWGAALDSGSDVG
jgi:hypothetical protein